jgi:probable HAF family extracellular repeat protein
MKSRTLTLIAAMTFSAALATAVRLTAQEQQEDKKEHHRYTVIDLGTLGGTFGEANAVNNRGWVVGDATLPGDTAKHAFLWRKGLMTDLGTLGGPNSVAFLLNERGQVVGRAETSTPDPNNKDFCGFGTGLVCRAFVWHHGEMIDLGTFGGNNSSAFAINNRGQVVGGAENATPDPTCTTYQFEFKPVIWEEGETQELPTFSGDPDGYINWINDHGQAVGASGNCANVASSHALLWQRNRRDEEQARPSDAADWTVIDLGNLGGTMNNIPLDINNESQVVGFSDLPGDSVIHAFLWTEEGDMQDLGTLSPDVNSLALGINDKGQIVGDSCDVFFSCRAFLWQNGTMTELNSLVHDPNAPFLENANSINSRGQIAGKTTVQGTPIADAFLAIPCDEEHADTEGCEDRAERTSAATGETSQRPRVVLPENVRKLLQRRLNPRFHFPGVKAGPTN